MKDLLRITFGLLVGLLAAGSIMLLASPPRGEAIRLLPSGTPAPLVVHISGAVSLPGVYRLPLGSRVLDAIEAAGGLLEDADPSGINLAAEVQDGSRISVPVLPPTAIPVTGMPNDLQTAPTLQTRRNPTAVIIININTATQAELESLPGIGPVLAEQVINYREANGPFEHPEDILDVPGIGPKTYEKFKHLISI